MLPLYRDPHFTFRFDEDRIIPRFHLDGVAAGTPVSVFALDPATGERLGLITEVVTSDDGWVDLPAPLVVRADGGFFAVAGSPRPGEDREPRTPTTCDRVRLRPVDRGDLPRLFEMQLDPESNRVAVTNPRTGEAFDAHWAKILGDPSTTARAVLLDETLVGTISCYPMDGQDHVGYWIDRAYWGRGIASRALRLLLREVTKRPLVASVATSNGGVPAGAPEVRLRRRTGPPLARDQPLPGVRGGRPCIAISTNQTAIVGWGDSPTHQLGQA